MFNHQMFCQFCIINFCSAKRACSLTLLSWLYLAFSITNSFICKLYITLHIQYCTFDLEGKNGRTIQDRSKQSQYFYHPFPVVFISASLWVGNHSARTSLRFISKISQCGQNSIQEHRCSITWHTFRSLIALWYYSPALSLCFEFDQLALHFLCFLLVKCQWFLKVGHRLAITSRLGYFQDS